VNVSTQEEQRIKSKMATTLGGTLQCGKKVKRRRVQSPTQPERQDANCPSGQTQEIPETR